MSSEPSKTPKPEPLGNASGDDHTHNPMEQPDGSGLCECGQVFEKLGETILSEK